MFRTGFLSIIVGLVLYTQHTVYTAVYTVLDSWWTENM